MRVSVLVHRILGIAFGLMLASCASSVDISKYPIPDRDTSPVELMSDQDEVRVKPHRHRARRSVAASTRKDEASGHTAIPPKRQQGVSATTGIDRHAIKTGASSESSSEAAHLSQIQSRFETPLKGSERWKKEEEENERLDRILNDRLRNAICRGC